MTGSAESDAPLFCGDVPGPESCCDSCHEDEDAGFDSLWTVVDGRDAHLCCARLRNLDTRVTPPERCRACREGVPAEIAPCLCPIPPGESHEPE